MKAPSSEDRLGEPYMWTRASAYPAPAWMLLLVAVSLTASACGPAPQSRSSTGEHVEPAPSEEPEPEDRVTYESVLNEINSRTEFSDSVREQAIEQLTSLRDGMRDRLRELAERETNPVMKRHYYNVSPPVAFERLLASKGSAGEYADYLLSEINDLEEFRIRMRAQMAERIDRRAERIQEARQRYLGTWTYLGTWMSSSVQRGLDQPMGMRTSTTIQFDEDGKYRQKGTITFITSDLSLVFNTRSTGRSFVVDDEDIFNLDADTSDVLILRPAETTAWVDHPGTQDYFENRPSELQVFLDALQKTGAEADWKLDVQTVSEQEIVGTYHNEVFSSSLNLTLRKTAPWRED